MIFSLISIAFFKIKILISIQFLSSEGIIQSALLHIEVIKGRQFRVRAIAIQASNDEIRWFLFPKEHQDPTEHPLLLTEIRRLKVKSYRNLVLKGEKLKPYLSGDCKSFQYKDVALVSDVEESINESINLVEDDFEQPKTKKRTRTSTPKDKLKKSKKVSIKPANEKPKSLSNFLQGYEFVKKMKLSAFDPYERDSEEWISNFENEYQKQSSVEDTGFTNILYLLKTEEGKKWHFRYRLEYTNWPHCKRDFILHFSEFYVKKLFQLKMVFDSNKETVQQFAQKQMLLWNRFFPSLSRTCL